MPVDSPSRRSVLVMAGVGLGTLPFIRSWTSTTAQEEPETSPEVAWARRYDDVEEEFEHTPFAVDQAPDGGYVLGGVGTEIDETGPGPQEFSLLKTDEDGEREWIVFGSDDHELEVDAASSMVNYDEGSTVIAGISEYGDDHDQERWYTTFSRAISFTADGDVAWTANFDPFEDTGVPSDGRNRLRSLTRPVDGGGPVAVGEDDDVGLMIKFDDEGSLAWRRRFEDRGYFDQAFTTSDGYGFIEHTGDVITVLHTDETGEVQRTVTLDVDYDSIPYNHEVTPSTDGGYALTGRYTDRQRMVLQTFDADGNSTGLDTYNGPYDGYDWATDIIATDDGGYALIGRMQEAYSGDNRPAIVKTDANRTEEWRVIVDVDSGGFLTGLQTDDGGYLGRLSKGLVKLEHADESTPTPATTPTPTDTPTPTPAETATPTPAETPASEPDDPPASTATPEEAETPVTDTPHEGDQAGSDTPGGETPGPDTPGATEPPSDDTPAATDPPDDGDGMADARDDDTEGGTDAVGTPTPADETPGFGTLAALGGIGGTAAYLFGRLAGDDGNGDDVR